MMEQARAPGRGAAACAGRRSRARPCSSPTRRTRRPAVAAPPPRSMRCARCSATGADRIVIANTRASPAIRWASGWRTCWRSRRSRPASSPPVPNFRDPDPELGELNLSQGGAYPIRYALRLAAGFGSQISMRCCAGRRSPTAAGAAPTSSATSTGSPIARRGRAWLRRASGYDDPKLEVVQHRLRVVDQGAPAQAAARAVDGGPSRMAEPAARRRWPCRARPRPRPSRSRRPCRSLLRSPEPRPPAPEPARAAPAGRAVARAASVRSRTRAGDRGGADGLPDRPAGHGPGPGGRPGDRHRQAGRGVRRDP